MEELHRLYRFLLYRLLRMYKLRGILIYLKIKLGLTKRISVPDVLFPIYLRKSTTDISTFLQIFGSIGSIKYIDSINFQPKTIIDLGANIGLTSVYFANKYPKSKIISIEPEKSNFAILKKNTVNYNNIFPIQKAISNINDKYVEILDLGLGHWGFMTKIKQNYANNTKSLVKTTTINEIMKSYNLDYIDILKIDIEGGEKELFETNFENWIPVTKCIIIELHDYIKKGCSKCFFNSISNYNFSLQIRGDNFILINEDL